MQLKQVKRLKRQTLAIILAPTRLQFSYHARTARADAVAMGGGELTLATLQGQVKRDPAAYREEFAQQHQRFEAELEIFRLKTAKAPEQRFGELVKFMSHVAPCYPEACARFPAQITTLLEERVDTLDPSLRMTLVQALILVRNRGLVDAIALFKLLFSLFRCVPPPVFGRHARAHAPPSATLTRPAAATTGAVTRDCARCSSATLSPTW